MFYEEKVINGVLHSRGTPGGKWRAVSAAAMTMIIEEARREKREAEAKLDDLVEKVSGFVRAL